MNRRMRKKRRAGEYQELGFQLGIYFRDGYDEKAIDNFADDFIDMIEANELCTCGSWHWKEKTFDMFIASVVPRGNSKRLTMPVTPEQRQAVYEWCKKRMEVYKLQVGPLVDAWNNTWEEVFSISFEKQMEGAEVVNEQA